jgi:hypothetical protein
MASAGDVSGAQAAAATLAPFWDEALHTRTPEERGRGSGLFDKALLAADAVADPGTGANATASVPYREPDRRVRGRVREDRARVRSAVDDGIAADMVGGDQPTWAYGRGQERPQWVAGWLPSLCQGVHATSDAGAVAARRLLDLAWEWLGKDIQSRLALSPPATATRNSANWVDRSPRC